MMSLRSQLSLRPRLSGNTWLSLGRASYDAARQTLEDSEINRKPVPRAPITPIWKSTQECRYQIYDNSWRAPQFCCCNEIDHVARTHTHHHSRHFLACGFSGRFGGYGYGYGHGGVGVIGIILIVLVVLVLMGRL